MRFKVVTFDCDGVMFHTEKANRAYYNDILTRFGRDTISEEDFAYSQAQTADNAVARLFPDRADFEEAQAYRKTRGYDPFIRLMEIDAELVPLLAYLRPAFKTAVATNRSDTMERVLSTHGIDPLFDLVVTAASVTRPKPAADPLVLILDHFGIGAGEMLYIGDSKLDELAAKAAGVPFAACRNPGLDADYHIDNLMKIREILNGSRGS